MPAAITSARDSKRSLSVTRTKRPSSSSSPTTLWCEMNRLLELRRLLGERAHQVLGEDLGKAGDVEDVFLGVERGELAAELRQRVDEARRRAAHSSVEEAEDPGRPPADDRDVSYLLLIGHDGK